MSRLPLEDISLTNGICYCIFYFLDLILGRIVDTHSSHIPGRNITHINMCYESVNNKVKYININPSISLFMFFLSTDVAIIMLETLVYRLFDTYEKESDSHE